MGRMPYTAEMILYSLHCERKHTFEAWFRDAAAFDEQATRGLVSCPHCGDTAITKAIMAPSLNKAVGHSLEARDPEVTALRQSLHDLRTAVETHCEPVGDRFAEEARAIHYGDAEERPIYGTTTPEEAAELKDEGIAVQHIPWLPDEN